MRGIAWKVRWVLALPKLRSCPNRNVAGRLTVTQYKCSGGTHLRHWGWGYGGGRLRWIVTGVPPPASMRVQNRLERTQSAYLSA